MGLPLCGSVGRRCPPLLQHGDLALQRAVHPDPAKDVLAWTVLPDDATVAGLPRPLKPRVPVEYVGWGEEIVRADVA